MKPKMTVEEKYDFLLEKLSRKFPDAGQGGLLDGDGFSFDFKVPEGDQAISLSVQVGANEDDQTGYVGGYVYADGGKTIVEEHLISYKMDEDFEAAVVRNFGFLLKQAQKFQEVA